jgi:putative FmdB family regulatory protein
MPIYAYKCHNCQHEYETLYLSFSAVEKEEPEERCPKCASPDKERLINKNTSFQLKGGGWAKDKYGGRRKE